MPDKKKLVIIGAGFAGALTARLAARKLRDVEVTLIDDSETFNFPARLPDVLARPDFPIGRLEAPYLELARRSGYQFVLGRVELLDRTRRELTLGSGARLGYDYAVVCVGSSENFFGVRGAREHTQPYLSYIDTVRLRQKAAGLPAGAHLVVVGGGATGVELMGGLAECTAKQKIHRVLVTALDDLLVEMHPTSRRMVRRRLERLGVEVMLNSPVTEVTDEYVRLKDGRAIPAHLTVWAGGIQPNHLSIEPATQHDAGGYLLVDEFLRVDDRVFAAGDCATCRDPKRAAPKTAQHARQMAFTVVENIGRAQTGQPLRPFRPVTLGYILTVGRYVLFDLHVLRLCSSLLAIPRDLVYRQRLAEITGRWPR